jgi:hypothetical protein
VLNIYAAVLAAILQLRAVNGTPSPYDMETAKAIAIQQYPAAIGDHR